MKVPPEWRQTPPEAFGKRQKTSCRSRCGACWALKENPNEVGSAGACGAVVVVDCA